MPKKKRKRSSKTERAQLKREIWAVVLALLGALFILALLGKLGTIGQIVSDYLTLAFGNGSWFFPVSLFAFSVSIFLARFFQISFFSFLGIILLFFSAIGLIHLFFIPSEFRYEPYANGGGWVGMFASSYLRTFLSDIGAGVVLGSFFWIGFVMTFQVSMVSFLLNILKPFYYSVIAFFNFVLKQREERKKRLENNKKLAEKKPVKKAGNKPVAVEKIKTKKILQSPFEIKRGEEKNNIEIKAVKPPENLEKEKEKIPTRPEDQDFSTFEKPSLDLLDDGKSDIHIPDSQLHEMGKKIVEKLAHFNIGTRMKSAFVGPTVTQFALEPDETVKLSKITGLKSELALALSAESVRIEAPIPGKNLVGIETPNPKRATVMMKEILTSREFQQKKGDLRLCIGKDVSGHPSVENLEEMPHLLIAGSTGSGKSVGMNAFLISMLFENSPADLRFIMVDPKRVELMPYEGIPHLLTPVITDAAKALSALRWSVSEMMRRLEEFAKVGARNIKEYNDRIDEMILRESEKPENERKEVPKKVPKIVIVIDELADLMMREHKKETENMICRIAQMARAVGIHLIIATQRPSVDVITGLIKANIPTRIAFTVTSAIDSRTVLDSIGAEDLLGRGDMLFTSPKFSRPKRIQGIYISGKEIEQVVQHLKMTISDDFFFESPLNLDDDSSSSSGGDFGGSGDTDDLLEDAIDLIRSTGKASASLLQRRLSVGYARAARILDIMEQRGMIGPSRGAKPREIFL